MSEPRQIAVVRTYDDFKNALRARADELQLSRDTIDAFGLPKGHAGHLLAPVPIKHIGPQSFGVLLTALGLKVLVVEDAEAFAIYAADAPKVRNASVGMLPKKKRQNKHKHAGDAQWSQIMNARRALIVSDQKRHQIASRAARARWRKPKIREIIAPPPKPCSAARIVPKPVKPQSTPKAP
jgi:hypothetical protein